jgi:hypothetical protein
MRFRSVYADSNALWEVSQRIGNGVWKCFIVNEPMTFGGRTVPGEYAGVVKTFMSAEILAANRHMEAVENLFDKQDEWYATQHVGTIVHYHNGFNSFVRCEIVDGVIRKGIGNDGTRKQKVLKPIALVGKWSKSDLPHYTGTGEIDYGYHADNIRKGLCWRANITCIYEHPDCNKERMDDPRQMSAIDLTPPQMPESHKAMATVMAKVEQVRSLIGHEAFNNVWNKDMTEDQANQAYETAGREQLRKVYELLKGEFGN